MHLFIELFTLGAFLVSLAWAIRRRGALGAWFYGSMLALGAIRENVVILREYLYGFAPLTLMLGAAPVISAIIWGFSIDAAVCWAERVTGERLQSLRWGWHFLLSVAAFMIALACFYEPFLKLIGMARWQQGTWTVLDVPLTALIGYPSLSVLFLLLWGAVMTRGRGTASRVVALLVLLSALAAVHAWGLQSVKSWLAW